jgi:hypothetical protein
MSIILVDFYNHCMKFVDADVIFILALERETEEHSNEVNFKGSTLTCQNCNLNRSSEG